MLPQNLTHDNDEKNTDSPHRNPHSGPYKCG